MQIKIDPKDYLALSEEEQYNFMRNIKKHEYIVKRRKELESEIRDLYDQVKELQDTCDHILIDIAPRPDDEGKLMYTFNKCQACGKTWET